MAERSEPMQNTDARRSRATAGLMFRVAADMAQVIDAWQLVYTTYRAEELIEPNTHRLHTQPGAASASAAVIVGSIGPLTVSTLTACHDTPEGLPLDRLFHDELEALRSQGRRLTEACLFADRRRHLNRASEALFDLMRHAFYYGVHGGATDFVLGVEPSRVSFFERALGMRVIGRARPDPLECDRPVALVHGDLRARLPENSGFPVLNYFLQHPVPVEMFTQRFGFDPRAMAGSELESFLDALRRRHA